LIINNRRLHLRYLCAKKDFLNLMLTLKNYAVVYALRAKRYHRRVIAEKTTKMSVN